TGTSLETPAFSSFLTKTSTSGKGWDPPCFCTSPDKSLSKSKNTAFGIWCSSYNKRPFALSCKLARTSIIATCLPVSSMCKISSTFNLYFILYHLFFFLYFIIFFLCLNDESYYIRYRYFFGQSSHLIKTSQSSTIYKMRHIKR